MLRFQTIYSQFFFSSPGSLTVSFHVFTYGMFSQIFPHFDSTYMLGIRTGRSAICVQPIVPTMYETYEGQESDVRNRAEHNTAGDKAICYRYMGT